MHQSQYFTQGLHLWIPSIHLAIFNLKIQIQSKNQFFIIPDSFFISRFLDFMFHEEIMKQSINGINTQTISGLLIQLMITDFCCFCFFKKSLSKPCNIRASIGVNLRTGFYKEFPLLYLYDRFHSVCNHQNSNCPDMRDASLPLLLLKSLLYPNLSETLT